MYKLSALAGMALMLTLAFAQPSASEQTDKSDPMAALAPFVGEWQVEGQWSTGEKLQARGVYQWGLGKKILKVQTFVMNGDKEYQRYESIMAWHPKKKCLYDYLRLRWQNQRGHHRAQGSRHLTYWLQAIPCR